MLPATFDRSSAAIALLRLTKVESLRTMLLFALLLLTPNLSCGSSSTTAGDLPFYGVAEQNVASPLAQGHEANETNRRCCQRGKRSGEGRFPYVCSVRKAGSREHVCLATLVHKKWLLTAANCVDPNSDKSAGCYPLIYCSNPIANTPSDEQVFHVVDAYLHEDWFGDTAYGADIAMLKLDRAANYPMPRLFREGMPFEKTMSVPLSRWIAEGEASHGCGRRSCTITWHGSKDCKKYPQIVSKKSWFCADGGKENLWIGETGSPVVLADRPNKKLKKGNPDEDLLFGFLSYDTSNPAGDRSAVYTSVAFFRTWIRKTIGGKSEPSRCLTMPKTKPKREHHDDEEQSESAPSSQVGIEKGEGETKEETEKKAESLTVEVEPEKFEQPVAGTEQKFEQPVAGTEQKVEQPGGELAEEPVEEAVPSATSPTKDGDEASMGSWSHSLGTEELLFMMTDAIRQDNEMRVELILNAGLDPNARFFEEGFNKRLLHEDSTLLHWAAAFNAAKSAKVLMEHSANTNLQSIQGETPLHVAAVAGSIIIAKDLIEHGANPKAIKTNGLTPLHYAAMTGHVDIAMILLDSGAEVSATSAAYGWTPLHYATASGKAEMVKLLLENGADTEAVDVVGRTPLHCAAQWKQLNTAKVLIKAGASKSRQDKNGRTPLNLVCSTDPSVQCTLEPLVELLLP